MPLPDLKIAKSDFEVTRITYPDPLVRKAVSSTLPVYVPGFVQYKPDPEYPPNILAGAQNRMACAPPPADKRLLREFRSFVRRWCRSNLTPLSSNDDMSVETWLESRRYPAWRKKELMDVYERRKGSLSRKGREVSAFVKDEFYPEPKHARGIYSRSDEFKVRVGPVFHAIEKKVFALDAFIKKIPVSQRPEYIRANLEMLGALYGAGDYTAYESHFIKELMEHCEFELYDYMTSSLPEYRQFNEDLRRVIAGTNVCKFKFLTILIEATRMSGEMNTSLGNGFTNLMVLSFLFERLGSKVLKVVVEGDDSLFMVSGVCPSTEDFKKLGFNVKLEFSEKVTEASFCGIITDTEVLANITDPVDVLVTFGWTSKMYIRASRKTRMTLLRCKSLSFAHQYPGCPIISALARYGLRVTRSYDVREFIERSRSFDDWERNKLRVAAAALKNKADLEIFDKPVETSTRLLMQRVYGISPTEQRAIEEYFDSLDRLGPLSGPVIDLVSRDKRSRAWETIFTRYVEPNLLQSDQRSVPYPTLESNLSGTWAVPCKTPYSK